MCVECLYALLNFKDGLRLAVFARTAHDPQSLLDDPLVCGVNVSGGGAAWNVAAFRRGGDARSIPRIRIPGEHTRDRIVLVGKLSEILNDKRPGRVVAAMFIDMAFGSPIYERLRALGFNNVFEVNFGLTHTPNRAKANMRAYMWGEMKDWLLKGAIEKDEKMAMDLAGPGYHINRSNLLVLESKADMQKRGQTSPDDGDALALTFAQAVAPAEGRVRRRRRVRRRDQLAEILTRRLPCRTRLRLQTRSSRWPAYPSPVQQGAAG
jgi:hypothetical protein